MATSFRDTDLSPVPTQLKKENVEFCDVYLRENV